MAAGLPRNERYYYWMSNIKDRFKGELYADSFRDAVSQNDTRSVLEKWYKTANGTGLLDSTLLTDQMTYLPNDLLVKVDIATMANSLEARSPFLDHKVIEFAASLPENLKMRGFQPKYLLKKVAARLVPRDVIYRKKMGFGVPIGAWFRGEMKEFVRATLLSEKAKTRGITDPVVVQRYVDHHNDGTLDHTHQIWSLLMLELWFQRFID
jgi:asparagine synthase (glutamine-hydrolysing)